METLLRFQIAEVIAEIWRAGYVVVAKPALGVWAKFAQKNSGWTQAGKLSIPEGGASETPSSLP